MHIEYGNRTVEAFLVFPEVKKKVLETEQMMQQAGKKYAAVIYEGAGHGFMRRGEQPEPRPANRKAREQAWQRWLELLKKL